MAGITTSFTWDTNASLPLLVDDGTNSYIYGPDGLPLEQIDRSGVVTWYHHDQLGSTRTLTNSTGAVVGSATYDAYGHLNGSTGKLSAFGFSGEYTDAETGFVYLRARYYDPTTGQFLSRDPLVQLTREPYAFAGGSPLNLSDPSGLSCGRSWLSRNWKWVALGGAALVAVGVVAFVALPALAEASAIAETEATIVETEAAIAEESGLAAEAESAGARSVSQVLDDLPAGRQAFVRTVPDEATLQATFEELTEGGAPTTWKGYAGDVFELPDGTQIGLRGTSSSGGATIDIRIPGQDPFKIHIG